MKPKLINGNPRWQDVEEIALRFLQMHLSNGVDKEVDMIQPKVRRAEAFECGTSACHAGWYLIYSDENFYTYSYDFGSRLMARDLGFTNYLDLTEWVYENPKIWGNENGDAMFSHNSAFNRKDPTKPITLKTISDHWLGVAKRLYEIQEVKSEIKN